MSPGWLTTILAGMSIALIALLGHAGVANADSGDVQTAAEAKVIQKSIQVVAGAPDTRDDSTQIAINNAEVEQLSAAESGSATATDGGTATSGDATADSKAFVHQLNIQIIAGKDCTATQIALNDAQVGQVAIAASGDATANGSGSSARSGDASASNRSVIHQKNKQLYICTGKGSGEPGFQVAANGAEVEQVAIAVSGDAEVGPNGNGTTGDATVSNVSNARQGNTQRARD